MTTFGIDRRAPVVAAALVATYLGLALHAAPATVRAHGHMDVGDYELVIGFINEPAYQGEPNGLDLRVTREAVPAADAGEHAAGEGAGAAGATAGGVEGTPEAGDHEHPSGESAAAGAAEPVPVEGLEETLKAEIIFGASKRELAIEAQWGEPGAYTANVLPTEAGDYTWRIFGTIDGTPVDVSMTSGADTFGAVESKDAVAFPAAEPAVSAVQERADAAAEAAGTAAGSARTALLTGILGTVLGALGMLTAVVAMRARRGG